jgi:hypothetical protein
MTLRWIGCHPGYFAHSRGGLYMVFKSPDRDMGTPLWMARFETKDQRLDFGGFDNLKDAKQSCDQHAVHFQALDCFQPGASALGNQGFGLILTESDTHVGFLTIFRRPLRSITSK